MVQGRAKVLDKKIPRGREKRLTSQPFPFPPFKKQMEGRGLVVQGRAKVLDKKIPRGREKRLTSQPFPFPPFKKQMEGRGLVVQGRAKVLDKKIPSPRSGEGGPKGRMGSLPPLELSTSKKEVFLNEFHRVFHSSSCIYYCHQSSVSD